MTNEWVVPYNPYLSKKYKAHINVESCASVQAIKYINKYVYKGQDRSTVALSDTSNEIHRYLQGRYIGPTEAFWRLFEYPIHEEDPTVMQLSLHLPDHQPVYFPDDASNEEVRTILDKSKSHLMAWFDYNRSNSDGREFLYQEFPEHYVYDRNLRNWKPRKKGFAIGRMQYCDPNSGEIYYLRLLLKRVKASKSFDDLKGVRRVIRATFKEACVELGLTKDDNDWIFCFQEASLFATGENLRSLLLLL
ncbi:hypothetical protein G6F56_003027 [Rhizopus delemar]|nr:hypothetical protein G6F56_003027 [Rhizopus delemar]